MQKSATRVVASATVCPHCQGTGVLVAIDPVAVVRAIFEHIGELPFTTKELVAHCVEDRALEKALADLPSRRLGKLLQRASVQPVDGFRVAHIGEESSGAIWQILPVGVR